jgi:hypothetical protein
MSSVGRFVAHLSQQVVGWRVVGAYSSGAADATTLTRYVDWWRNCNLANLGTRAAAIAGTMVLSSLLGVQFIAVLGGAAAGLPFAALAQRQAALDWLPE